nr:hypothetical protein BSM_09510 [uncultured archaeon]
MWSLLRRLLFSQGKGRQFSKGHSKRCEKLDFLKPNHGDAHLKNLRKIKKHGIEKFLGEKRYWYNKMK